MQLGLQSSEISGSWLVEVKIFLNYQLMCYDVYVLCILTECVANSWHRHLDKLLKFGPI